MKRYTLFLFLFVMSFVICTQLVWAKQAEVHMHGTQSGSRLSGTVKFKESARGIQITAKIKNAPAGKHGFHIHQNGDCANGGKAAGGHFNPDGVDHGDILKDGTEHAHAGDLGNIIIDENGNGIFSKTIPFLSLKEGEHYSVVGRAVVMHADEDDFSQPTGNAGARIGCGVIN